MLFVNISYFVWIKHRGCGPLKEISEREHEETRHGMPISDVDMGVHAMVEGSFCDEVQEGVTSLSQDHEKMWLEFSE